MDLGSHYLLHRAVAQANQTRSFVTVADRTDLVGAGCNHLIGLILIKDLDLELFVVGVRATLGQNERGIATELADRIKGFSSRPDQMEGRCVSITFSGQ